MKILKNKPTFNALPLSLSAYWTAFVLLVGFLFMIKVCQQCKKDFKATKQQVQKGFGIFCSSQCRRASQKENRPSKNCLHCSAIFYRTPSAITVAKYCSYACVNKAKTGDGHPLWTGDNASYKSLHLWVSRRLGKACICSKCKSEVRVEWANVSHDYRRDLSDWIQLCQKCHNKYDRGENRGAIKKHFDHNLHRL